MMSDVCDKLKKLADELDDAGIDSAAIDEALTEIYMLRGEVATGVKLAQSVLLDIGGGNVPN
jgi:hypothetical protein